MICLVCGEPSGNKKTCSTKCRVSLHRLVTSKDMGTPAFLYIAKFDDVIKFGCSRDPFIRLRQIELASGRIGGELTVYGPIQVAFYIERDIHKAMSDRSICGEWYKLDALPDIIEMIERNEEISIGHAANITRVNEQIIGLESYISSVLKAGNRLDDVFGFIFGGHTLVSIDAPKRIASMLLEIGDNSMAVNALEFVVDRVFGCGDETSMAIARMLKSDPYKAAEIIDTFINCATLFSETGELPSEKTPHGEILCLVAKHLVSRAT